MIADVAARLGCRSVAFTYNDPVIFMEYAIDVADACRERGLHPVAVTAGYVCAEPRAELFRHMDAANVDLKAFTEEFYQRVTVGHLQPVLDTLDYLRHETDVWLEITNLVIPGHNDGDDELDAMAAWIAEHLGPGRAAALHRVPSGLQDARRPAHPAGHADPGQGDRPSPRPPVRVHRQRPRPRRVEHARVPGADGGWSNADWYVLGDYHLTADGRCRSCGTPIPGRFDGPPGTWGARRLPVRLAAVPAEVRLRRPFHPDTP